ncbi:hypothetical protein BS78_07G043800 [Paspalum vaginatum]|nr:hypothetical protein BS78_07G043800 [Paspalum vaginatum]
MVTSVKPSSQGLLLLALVVMAFSVIPAPVRGENIDGRKSKMASVAGANKAVIQDDKFNGCHYNSGVHDEGSIFCCSKDKLCWPNLTVCVNNCPCKTNC